MRIISQDKTLDLRYEKYSLVCEMLTENSFCIKAYGIGNQHIIGFYSSKEKCVAVMKMIRDFYSQHYDLFPEAFLTLP